MRYIPNRPPPNAAPVVVGNHDDNDQEACALFAEQHYAMPACA